MRILINKITTLSNVNVSLWQNHGKLVLESQEALASKKYEFLNSALFNLCMEEIQGAAAFTFILRG